MKFPEKVRISIDLVKKLRESSDFAPKKVQNLSKGLGTTDAFLWQIVRRLGKEGIVNVVRGPGGGVAASLNPTSALTICQVMGYLKKEEELSTTASGLIKKQLRDFLAKTEV